MFGLISFLKLLKYVNIIDINWFNLDAKIADIYLIYGNIMFDFVFKHSI